MYCAAEVNYGIIRDSGYTVHTIQDSGWGRPEFLVPVEWQIDWSGEFGLGATRLRESAQVGAQTGAQTGAQSGRALLQADAGTQLARNIRL